MVVFLFYFLRQNLFTVFEVSDASRCLFPKQYDPVCFRAPYLIKSFERMEIVLYPTKLSDDN